MRRIHTAIPSETETALLSAEMLLIQYDSYIIAQVKSLAAQWNPTSRSSLLSLDIDDLIQIVRIKLWERVQKQPIRSPSAYIRKIILNEFRLLSRQRHFHLPLFFDEEGEPLEGNLLIGQNEEETNPTFELEQQALFSSIAKIIDGFPSKQRRVLLIDIATHTHFSVPPTPLHRAFLSAGIHLQNYLDLYPSTEDTVARSRYASLLSIAYNRLARLFRSSNDTSSTLPPEVEPHPLPSQGDLTRQKTARPSPQTLDQTHRPFEKHRKLDAPSFHEWDSTIHLLPDPYRTVLTLHFRQKQTYTEIATYLRLPIGTVKSHVHRGKQLLQAETMDESQTMPHQYRNDRPTVPGFDTLLLNRLPTVSEPYQTALRLHYLEQLTYPDMATQLKLPIGTVKSHVSRGKKILLATWPTDPPPSPMSKDIQTNDHRWKDQVEE